MAYRRGKKERPSLDPQALNELALTYVGRFATTRAKLAAYLGRKLRERGWGGERPADIEAIVERLSGLGYVDDAAYALSKSRSLTARGYGARRVHQSLLAAGVAEEDSEEARDLAETEKVESALRFAKRRRLGPFSENPVDQAARERALAAMIRAGHSFALAKAILSFEPGTKVSIEILGENPYLLL
jgi:regulatory protein